MMDYQSSIINHYERVFNNEAKIYLFDKGPFEKMPADFRILEFPPTETRNMWTYATCCMSQPEDAEKIEIHMFSFVKDEGIIELLTALAFYHRHRNAIGLNHTVYFGLPRQYISTCDYGFISLPYIDGPDLQDFNSINFFWLIPVTEEEVEYKKQYGIDALETKFEEQGLNYLDVNRTSLV